MRPLSIPLVHQGRREECLQSGGPCPIKGKKSSVKIVRMKNEELRGDLCPMDVRKK